MFLQSGIDRLSLDTGPLKLNESVLLQALQGYKYRLKLTPGSQRKGKAARQVGWASCHLPNASELPAKRVFPA